MQYEFIENSQGTCLKPEYLQLVTVAVFWHSKILLVRRNAPPFKGFWSLPGGHVEKDEAYKDAARRELLEEIGIKADDLLPMTVFIDHEHKLECHGFSHVSLDGVFSNLDVAEQEVVGWAVLADALQLPLTPGLKEALQKIGSK
jgi:ADP-ribose pyrophosphatase YjhB (NUDIX family)